MLVGVEEVERLPDPARTSLLARAEVVSDGVERISVRDLGVANTGEDRVEVGPRHREGQVIPSLRPPGRELQRELARDPDDREGAVGAVEREAENRRVERG